MSEQVFSEGVGSPRLPSASFARVELLDPAPVKLRELPSVLARHALVSFHREELAQDQEAVPSRALLDAMLDEVHADRAARRAVQ